jgi:hypothetical protein
MIGSGFGIAMTNRQYVCVLCKRAFSRMGGDLLFIEDSICDECLEELGKLELDARRLRVVNILLEQGWQGRELENRILQAVSGLLEQKRRMDQLKEMKPDNET